MIHTRSARMHVHVLMYVREGEVNELYMEHLQQIAIESSVGFNLFAVSWYQTETLGACSFPLP